VAASGITTPKCEQYVAIKIIDKKKLASIGEGIILLLNEIRVHWNLTECDGVL
jgi:hypothetical protein